MDLRRFAGYTLFAHQSNYLTPFPFSLFFVTCYVEHVMSFASFHATYAYSFLVPSYLTDYDYLIVIAPGLLSSLPTTSSFVELSFYVQKRRNNQTLYRLNSHKSRREQLEKRID
ncbi:expressed protein [Echinococcus multilocularis]|uniref:Expressed protein n=1 Tax=Echinococcus multilocularis TaxID=6211 RepID=A0A068YAS4_ECHMU|nr:expressed protein [Echinococcus multilocularis]